MTDVGYPSHQLKIDPRMVNIRKVTVDDLESLEWDGEYRHFRRTYRENYNRTLVGTTKMWIMTHRLDLTIGQLFVQLNSNNHTLADGRHRAYIFSFRIRKEFRSQGLGTYFLNFAEDDLLHHGYKIITLNVAQTNHRALKLYEQNGYHVIGPDPGIWSYQNDDGEWIKMEEPAWRLEKNLVLA